MKGVEQIEHSLEHTIHNLASPKRGHTFWGLVLVLAVSALLVWLKHGSWLQSPNEVMIGTGESFKNYICSAWHVQRDSGYVHYNGMNYPFGEHVLFTNNQPVLSAAIQWWNRHVFDVSDRVVGIINVLQVISIVFGAGVIYLLLRKLHLPVWYAGLAALGIAFLSPQYNRFDGQFGLSHIWVMPMLLFLLCRYEERHSRRYQSLLIGILLWFSAQIHFYYFGISAVFLGFYTLFQIGINPVWRNIWTRFSHLIAMVLLPFALLNVWLHWSDYCADRSVNPEGFSQFVGHWQGIFLPYPYFPLYRWINGVSSIAPQNFETQTYVGLAAGIFTLWLIFARRFRLFESNWEIAAYHRVHKNYLRGVCFAAFATLLLGMGLPFTIPGMEWMVDDLGFFRQFRGLARFTWVFYYAIYLLIFYIAWNRSHRVQIGEKWLARLNAKSAAIARYLPATAKWAVALFPLVLVCWEAYYFQINKPIRFTPNLTQRSVVASAKSNWLNKVDFARFQALMPLPYYHVGSENIWFHVDSSLFQKVQYTALQTGVPDMGVNLSRTALSQTVKSVQFALPACEPPALLSELPDNQPIALMIEPDAWESVQQQYPHLLAYATPVYQGPELKIMSLIPDSVRAWSQQRALECLSEMNRTATENAGQGWKSDKKGVQLVYINYDSLDTGPFVFQGKGAAESNMYHDTPVWDGALPPGKYRCSLWIKADEDMALTQDMIFEEINPEKNGTDSNLNRHVAPLREKLKTIVNGWALFETVFEVKAPHSGIRVFFAAKNLDRAFWFDEFLLKEEGIHLYKKEPGWVVRDNYWHKMPKN